TCCCRRCPRHGHLRLSGLSFARPTATTWTSLCKLWRTRSARTCSPFLGRQSGYSPAVWFLPTPPMKRRRRVWARPRETDIHYHRKSSRWLERSQHAFGAKSVR
ncbi:unnamed protein product, partial [Ectocarpus sp. 12 AP-2014]